MKNALMTAFMMAAFGAGGAASAGDPVTGVWQTPPDRKDLVSHIEIAACGDKLCGRVLRAYDSSGAQVSTKNIGKRIFWGIEPLGNGNYGNGTAWVPLLDVHASASMTLSGNTLRVRGCKAVLCDSQTWVRLQ